MWRPVGRRWGAWLAALGLSLLLLAGCGGVAPVVKIGLVAPFEGAHRAVGYDAIYAARLAVREINAAGGVGGYRVALVALDDSGDVKRARQAAASLTLDPMVVAVVGHWLTETTAVAAPIYAAAGLPLLAAGRAPLGETPPAQLPPAFRAAYAAVTPFEETTGVYAGTTYDAFQLLFTALDHAAAAGPVDRAAVTAALVNLQIAGITGPIYQPPP